MQRPGKWGSVMSGPPSANPTPRLLPASLRLTGRHPEQLGQCLPLLLQSMAVWEKGQAGQELRVGLGTTLGALKSFQQAWGRQPVRWPTPCLLRGQAGGRGCGCTNPVIQRAQAFGSGTQSAKQACLKAACICPKGKDPRPSQERGARPAEWL